MSKVITLEVVDIFDGIAVLETEGGFEIEIDLESLPQNLKVGQSVKCSMTLNPTTVDKERYVSGSKKDFPNGKQLTY